MTTSGTYAADYEVSEIVDEAFERCGVDPASLTDRHSKSARRSLQLLFSEWANRGIHLWAVDTQNQTVTDGDATYTVATGTVTILEMVVRRSGTDTQVSPMSRADYLLMPDKDTEGLANQYWLDRATGVYTLWPVPDNSTDVIYYTRLRQLQDVGNGSRTADVPFRWLEAMIAGLAAKLAMKFAPDRVSALSAFAEQQYKFAYQEDRERVDLRFTLG